jgi:hypothetical protein
MPDDIAPLLDRIRYLVDEEAERVPDELLAEIEYTLTDGYAHALALEGESLRIGREIGERVTRVGKGEPATDLSVLAQRLSRTESDVTRLRAQLDRLRGRAEVVRRSVSNGSATTQDRSGPHIQRPGYGFRSAAS